MYRSTLQYGMMMLAIAMTLACVTGCDPNAKHKEAIQLTWTTMKSGYDTNNGASVAKQITRESLDHYARVCKQTLDLPEVELLKQPMTTMVEVLEARRKCTRKEIEKLDGTGFVTLVVNKGCWAGALDGMELTDIKVTGDFAQASLYYPELEKEYRSQALSRALGGRRSRFGGGSMDKPPRYPVRFVKEQDGWKYDELSVLPNWDKEYLEWARVERLHPRELVTLILEEDGEDLPKTAWQPMKK